MTEPAVEPTSSPSTSSGSRSRWPLPLAAFVVGAAVGVGVMLVLDAADDPSCGEARTIVDDARDAIEELDGAPVQDAGFFAALVVEQQRAAFAMSEAPSCFSLTDRAGTAALLAGVQALIDSGIASTPDAEPASE